MDIAEHRGRANSRSRQDFVDKSYFLVSAISNYYYFNDTKSPCSAEPRYHLKTDDPHDAWFFSTMKSDKPFNINVAPDIKLGLTKVWFNVIVKDGGRKIGRDRARLVEFPA